mmetsp:Transcript_26193/g.37555  ORF Transcript_26193/g.37555 Transcript_26193/m.37555 type:complete len:173 (-) Transcript_26193:1943-2461(-)
MNASLLLRLTAFLHIIVLLSSVAHAIDVSWIPVDGDGDGPLPLSKNYRDKLRKLCVIIKGPRPPPELAETSKRGVVLRKMCNRLEKDDKQGDFSLLTMGASTPKAVLVGLVGVGIAVFQYWPSIYQSVENFMRSFIRQQSQKNLHPNVWDDLANEKLREARMKRFVTSQKGD